MGSTGAQKGKLDVGRCFNDAIEVYKENVGTLVLATFLFEILSFFSLLVLAGPLSGGYYHMMLKAMRDKKKKIELGDMFEMLSRFLPLMGLFYFETIIIFIGFFMLFLPGLFLTTMWLFPFLVMVDKNEGVFSSLGKSWQIVARKGFLMNLLVCLVYLAFSIGAGTVPYFGWVVGLFLIPLGSLVLVSAYIQQVDEDSGELADLFKAA
jgi:hypothetical protein